jgi:hypothetical protein
MPCQTRNKPYGGTDRQIGLVTHSKNGAKPQGCILEAHTEGPSTSEISGTSTATACDGPPGA